MRTIRRSVVLAAVAGMIGLGGCSRNSGGGNTSPEEPTAAQAQQAKEWQSAVDDEEKTQEQLGLRASPKDPEQLRVEREEREHRAEMGEGPKPKTTSAKK